MNTPCSDTLDEALFESYGRLINPAYPQFLKRLGLNQIAVRAEGATITDSEGRTFIDCIGGYGLFIISEILPFVRGKKDNNGFLHILICLLKNSKCMIDKSLGVLEQPVKEKEVEVV